MYGKCLKHPLVLFSSQKHPNFTLKTPQKEKENGICHMGKKSVICPKIQPWPSDLEATNFKHM